METVPPSGDRPPDPDLFLTTRWTVVAAAGGGSSPDSARALAELCQVYWFPLYAYVRKRSKNREDAEDLTQGFFERFLKKNYLAGVAVERGKFRAYLLAALKHFLANERDRGDRAKRGGGATHLSLDWEGADERFRGCRCDTDTPDRAFDRGWAYALLEQVLSRLESECRVAGKGALFDQAKGYLMLGESAVPYAEAAGALGMEEGAVRVAVLRLRKRYRTLLRQEIAQTLVDPQQVDAELDALRAALAS